MKHAFCVALYVLCLVLMVPSRVASQTGPRAETLAEVIAATVPVECGAIQKEWHYKGFRFVCMEQPGMAPDATRTAALLQTMTVTPTNCALTFLSDKQCSLALGKKRFRLHYTYDAEKRTLRASLGLFSISGRLMKEDNDLLLIYSKEDLFLMMRFLCPLSAQKSIDELSDLLDVTKGLTLGIRFE